MEVQKQSTKLEFLLTLSRSTVSYLVVNKTKNKNPFFCQVFPRQNRRENLSGKPARQNCAKYHKKKNSNFVFYTLGAFGKIHGKTFIFLKVEFFTKIVWGSIYRTVFNFFGGPEIGQRTIKKWGD